jgi:two-component system sensor histidine kinase KdpD
MWDGSGPPWVRRRGLGFLLAVGLVALITTAIGLIPAGLRLEQRSPLYLVAVLATGALFGRGPAIAAAFLSFAAYNWFFVEPANTLHVANPDEWQALLLFLLAAVVTGHLTALLRDRVEVANRRERETVLLFEMGKALAGAGSTEAGLVTATERLKAGLALDRCDVLLEGDGRFRPLRGPALERNDHAAALWVRAHATPAWRAEAAPGRQPAGDRIQLKPSTRRGAGVAFLPLIVDGRVVGVLYAARSRRAAPGAHREEARLLASACDQLALAVERGRLQRESVQAEVLRRTDDLRSALLSSVSHDLRTPLATIKAAAGSLLQQDVSWDDVSRRAFAAQIERETDRLNRLVGNLLDLSRIEAGALVLDRQWYPLWELVEDTLARLGPMLTRHRVETDVPETLPPVYLDYLLVQQVLVNLVENAAKYSPAGTRIRVSAAVDPQAEHVRVRVEDEGPGLPPGERERIFERFYRIVRPEEPPDGAPPSEPDGTGGTGPTPRPRGTGFGLAVCAGFVAAHGGRIWAEAAGGARGRGGRGGEGGGDAAAKPGGVPGGPGAGTAFVFELPLGAPPEAGGGPADAPGRGALHPPAGPPPGGTRPAEVYRRPRTRRAPLKGV